MYWLSSTTEPECSGAPVSLLHATHARKRRASLIHPSSDPALNKAHRFLVHFKCAVVVWCLEPATIEHSRPGSELAVLNGKPLGDHEVPPVDFRGRRDRTIECSVEDTTVDLAFAPGLGGGAIRHGTTACIPEEDGSWRTADAVETADQPIRFAVQDAVQNESSVVLVWVVSGAIRGPGVQGGVLEADGWVARSPDGHRAIIAHASVRDPSSLLLPAS